MRIIGITGGIGSGKSRVLSYMEAAYQAVICQADHVAWELQRPGEACYMKIVESFGKGILNQDQTINRKALGDIVFANKEALMELNRIVHPAVKEDILQRICTEREKGTPLFLLEAALLLEENYDKICDEVWYIYSNEAVRRDRLKESRAYTDEKIDAIIAAQSKEQYFLDNCQKTIDNSSSFEVTCMQIEKALNG